MWGVSRMGEDKRPVPSRRIPRARALSSLPGKAAASPHEAKVGFAPAPSPWDMRPPSITSCGAALAASVAVTLTPGQTLLHERPAPAGVHRAPFFAHSQPAPPGAELVAQQPGGSNATGAHVAAPDPPSLGARPLRPLGWELDT